MRKRTKKMLILAISSTLAVAALPSVAISLIHPSLNATNHLIGHRGWSAKYFQNTYAAFQGAVGSENSKFWGAETDLQMDENGKIWCSHYINPFEDGSERINKLTTTEIQTKYLKINGDVDTSSLPSKAFPIGSLNPYHINVPHDSDNDQLCLFWDASDPTPSGKGYLNTFLNNSAHPIIELKIESMLIGSPDENGCMKIDQDVLTTFITNILVDVKAANDESIKYSTSSLSSRCYFVSFFDDLLAETIKQMENDTYFNQVNHNQFQKLLDDGGIGQYVLSDNSNFTNKTPGSKSGSSTNFKNYAKYTNGSWYQFDKFPNYPIGLDVYYALLTSKMIANAHKNGVEVNCWTADYTRTEIAEALSLDILAKSGCDYITTDEWYDLK